MYGQPVAGMVIVTDSPLLKEFAGRATIMSDLLSCRESVGMIREETERFIADQTTPTLEQMRPVHEAWSFGMVAYGRCFLSATGRSVLKTDDVKRLKGDIASHKGLLQQRNEIVAHVTLHHRKIEVFARLQLPPLGRGVRSLAVIESYTSLPGVDTLRAYERHLIALTESLQYEMKDSQARISQRLSEKHCDELYECLRDKSKWR